jgi:hypothetical protein
MQTSDVVNLREYVAAFLYETRPINQQDLEDLRSDPDLYTVGDDDADTLSTEILDVLTQGETWGPNEDRLVERVADRAIVGYTVHDQGVQEFLASNPNVALLIWDNHTLVRQVFGDDATPILDLLFDPDDGEEDFLYLKIETSLPPDVALNRLQELDQMWKRSTSPLDDSRFVMDVVFR